MIRTHSLTSARSFAPEAFRRWVLGGIVMAVIGYALITVLEFRELGVAALGKRNAILTLVCAASWVVAWRVNDVLGCTIALAAAWIEVETEFYHAPVFPGAGMLVLPALVIAAGLLFGARPALWVAIATVITTIVMASTSPMLQHGQTSESLYWFAMHAISIATVWTLVTLSLSAFTRAFDAMEAHERDLSDTIRFAPDGILVATREGRVVLANTMAESILRRSSAQLVSHQVDAILTEVSGQAVHLESMRSGDGDAPLQFQLELPGDDPTTIEITWRHMERNRDQFLVRDVTPRIRAERRRREMEVQLSHAQRLDAVGRLAGGLSHDFNNILTAVSGSAELLRIETNASERAELLDEIIAARDRGVALTRQLLAFARREVTQPRIIDLSEHLRALERLLQRVAGDRNRLRLEIAPDCRVRVDPGQLEQSLVNLVANARDAMPHGGTCTIVVERVTAAGGVPRVRLHVDDEGIGMSDEIAARAFEPFFTTKPRGQGTGLGLASVHGMAEQSEGSAYITSRSGHGTRVTIELPWVDAPASRTPDMPAPAPTRTGPQSILVAEDDSGTRRVVQRILEHAGYIVQTADDGTEAMALIENTAVSFDLVLSDVMMPGHTGPEIMDRVRARRPGTPVLLMTGYAEEQLSELLAAGAGREIITKPFSTESLLARVSALLNATMTARTER